MMSPSIETLVPGRCLHPRGELVQPWIAARPVKQPRVVYEDHVAAHGMPQECGHFRHDRRVLGASSALPSHVVAIQPEERRAVELLSTAGRSVALSPCSSRMCRWPAKRAAARAWSAGATSMEMIWST